MGHVAACPRAVAARVPMPLRAVAARVPMTLSCRCRPRAVAARAPMPGRVGCLVQRGRVPCPVPGIHAKAPGNASRPRQLYPVRLPGVGIAHVVKCRDRS